MTGRAMVTVPLGILLTGTFLAAACDDTEDSDLGSKYTSVVEQNCRLLECDLYSECEPDFFKDDYENIDECYEACQSDSWLKNEYSYCETMWEEDGFSTLEECRTQGKIEADGRKSLKGCKAACTATDGEWIVEGQTVEQCEKTCSTFFSKTCIDAMTDLGACYEKESSCDNEDWIDMAACEDALSKYIIDCGLPTD